MDLGVEGRVRSGHGATGSVSHDEKGAPPDLRLGYLEIAGVELRVLSFPWIKPHLDGETPLTRAEAEVAALAVERLSNAEIAERRGTSPRTVVNQMAAVLTKLGVSSRRELAARYLLNTLQGEGDDDRA